MACKNTFIALATAFEAGWNLATEAKKDGI